MIELPKSHSSGSKADSSQDTGERVGFERKVKTNSSSVSDSLSIDTECGKNQNSSAVQLGMPVVMRVPAPHGKHASRDSSRWVWDTWKWEYLEDSLK